MLSRPIVINYSLLRLLFSRAAAARLIRTSFVIMEFHRGYNLLAIILAKALRFPVFLGRLNTCRTEKVKQQNIKGYEVSGKLSLTYRILNVITCIQITPPHLGRLSCIESNFTKASLFFNLIQPIGGIVVISRSRRAMLSGGLTQVSKINLSLTRIRTGWGFKMIRATYAFVGHA